MVTVFFGAAAFFGAATVLGATVLGAAAFLVTGSFLVAAGFLTVVVFFDVAAFLVVVAALPEVAGADFAFFFDGPASASVSLGDSSSDSLGLLRLRDVLAVLTGVVDLALGFAFAAALPLTVGLAAAFPLAVVATVG